MNGAYFADAVYHPGTKMAYVYNPEGHYQGYVSFSSEPYTYYTYTAKGALTMGGESISGPETELRAIAYVYIKDKTLQFKFIEQEDIISP